MHGTSKRDSKRRPPNYPLRRGLLQEQEWENIVQVKLKIFITATATAGTKIGQTPLFDSERHLTRAPVRLDDIATAVHDYVES